MAAKVFAVLAFVAMVYFALHGQKQDAPAPAAGGFTAAYSAISGHDCAELAQDKASYSGIADRATRDAYLEAVRFRQSSLHCP